MHGGAGMNVNVGQNVTRLAVLLYGFSVGQRFEIGATVQRQIVSIRIDGSTGRFNLWPPLGDGQRKQFAGAGQRRDDFTFPLNVALIASAPVAIWAAVDRKNVLFNLY